MLFSGQPAAKNPDLANAEVTKFTSEFCTYFSENKTVSFPQGLANWPYLKSCSVEGNTNKSVYFYTEQGPIDDVIMKGLETQIKYTFKKEAADLLKALLKLKEKFP